MPDPDSIHDPWNAKNLILTYTETFEDDGYVLTDEIAEKYKASEDHLPPFGCLIRVRSMRLFKNVSIFDVSGLKLTWGDLAPRYVEKMMGVYYILSEHKSFWKVAKSAVKIYEIQSANPNPFVPLSPFQELLPKGEATMIDVAYMKKNAIARIVDGVIQTSRELISKNYQ